MKFTKYLRQQAFDTFGRVFILSGVSFVTVRLAYESYYGKSITEDMAKSMEEFSAFKREDNELTEQMKKDIAEYNKNWNRK